VQFESLSDFIHMNGHGFFVWLSYALGLAIIIGNVLQPLMKRKELMQSLAKRLLREKNSQ
jgi:heme exporter protein D